MWYLSQTKPKNNDTRWELMGCTTYAAYIVLGSLPDTKCCLSRTPPAKVKSRNRMSCAGHPAVAEDHAVTPPGATPCRGRSPIYRWMCGLGSLVAPLPCQLRVHLPGGGQAGSASWMH